MAERLSLVVDRIESVFAVCEILNGKKSVNVPLTFFDVPPKEGNVYHVCNIFSAEQFVGALTNKLQIKLLYDESLTKLRRECIFKKMKNILDL